MANHKRWYDDSELGEYINQLENKEKDDRDQILIGMKNIIIEYDSEIIMNNIFDFPVQDRKRWYDRDPVSWVVINVLKYLDKTLLNQIIAYLKKKAV